MQCQDNILNCIDSSFNFFKQHQADFTFLTVIVCFIFAAILLIPAYRQNFSDTINQWVKPLGWTFIILGLIYLVRLIFWRYFPPEPEGTPPSILFEVGVIKITKESVSPIITDILSGFSNFFLVIAANNLKVTHKKSKSIILEFLEKRWRKLFLGLIIISIIVAIFSRLADNSFSFLKFIDHSISSFALILFGLILFRELAFRRSHILAFVILLSTIFYGCVFLFRIFQLLYGDDIRLGNDIIIDKTESGAFIVAFSLILKAGMFFPAYYLITLATNELNGIRKLLETVAVDRREFLESDGILKNIKETLKADKVSLYIKLPGKKRELVSLYQNPPSERYENDPHKRPEIIEIKKTNTNVSEINEIYMFAFKKNITITHNVTSFNNTLSLDEVSRINDNDSIIVEPIRYHGAVIGCLEARLTTKALKFHFANTDVQQIQRIAVMLTRVLQANREIAGLDQLITSLGSLQTDKRILIADKAIMEMLDIMDDLFNPLAIGLFTNIGFEAHLRSYTSQSDNKGSKYKEKIENKLSREQSQKQEDFEETISYIMNDLIVPSKVGNTKTSERRFGRLVIAIPSKNDLPNSPTLFTYHLLCRLIANVISDAYLDFARDYFNRHIKELTIKLNSPSNKNISTWFETVKNEILEVDLLWAVVGKEEHPNEFIGENKDVIKYLYENKKPEFEEDGISIYDIYQYKSELPKQFIAEKHKVSGQDTRETNHVIKIRLKEFEGSLWLGIERKGFGSEIKIYETSPWKIFLERLAEISDSSLLKITEKDEKEYILKEAAEFHGLATAAITTGTLLHQIGNQVKEVTSPIEVLKDALLVGRIRGTKETWQRILSLNDSKEKLFELTKLLSGVVKVDTHRPCKLGEIIQESEKLCDAAFDSFNIEYKNTLSKKLEDKEIDIPFYVGSFAITNLLTNAKDAIKNARIEKGKITIKATENEKSIFLYVTDNGPGITLEDQSKIFEKGFTTKSDGTGLGLFFTANSLTENGSSIILEKSVSNQMTAFRIQFPKLRV